MALNFGEVTVQAGAASLLIAAGPVFTALLSALFLGERLTRLGWGGILLAFTGVSLIALSSGKGLRFTPGALLILLSAAVAAVYSILSKRSLRRYSALEFTCYSIWAGTLPMLVFLPGLIHQLPYAAPAATLAVVYLGIFPAAIAYVLWNYALARMPAVAALQLPLPLPGDGQRHRLGVARRNAHHAHHRGRRHRHRRRHRRADEGSSRRRVIRPGAQGAVCGSLAKILSAARVPPRPARAAKQPFPAGSGTGRGWRITWSPSQYPVRSGRSPRVPPARR